jgi:hypothetical protein
MRPSKFKKILNLSLLDDKTYIDVYYVELNHNYELYTIIICNLL